MPKEVLDNSVDLFCNVIFGVSTAMLCLGMFLFAAPGGLFGADLESFENARLVSDRYNDGDSFRVALDDKTIVVRLYFVDCPETAAGSLDDAERLREQTRYFGLSNVADTVRFGDEAAEFTRKRLAEPFTLYTTFATAPGRSSERRVYGFVITSSGNDLANLLVANGYARTHGAGRQTAGGVSREETSERLRDLEMSAMLKHSGVWALSDPDRIVPFRAEQRSDEEELKIIQEKVAKPRRLASPIDLNKASKEELTLIKGIGPVLADRIVKARPYKTVDELTKVDGIGKGRLEIMRPHLVIERDE